MKSNKQLKREAKQLFRRCFVHGVLDENRARHTAQLVVAARYRRRLTVLAHFLRLVKLECARHTANVESAALLPADLQAVIEASLKSRYGAGLTTTFTQRPTLIGGVRIQVASDVYDGSVLAGLSALEKSF